MASDNSAYVSGEDEVAVDLNRDDMQIDRRHDKPYAGMPKEVLLRYSRQRKFVWARNILTCCVFLALLLLLSLIIAFIAVSPACQQFHQTDVVYEIDARSFYDSDGDGRGDVAGVVAKLDYLAAQLGARALLVRHVIDTDDWRRVDEEVGGSVDDLVALVTAAHERGMHVMVELDPNHTGVGHDWFTSNPEYYITSDTVPNNWQSVRSSPDDDTSAWSLDSASGKYYYHAFESSFADLDFNNEKVKEEFKDVLRYWLELNVDGFRFTDVNFIYESSHMRDEQLIDAALPPAYDNLYHDFTRDQPQVHDLLMEWRSLLDEYSTEPGVYRYMETLTSIDESAAMTTRYYGNRLTREADVAFNTQLLRLDDLGTWSGHVIEQTISDWMTTMASDKWPNWRLGTASCPRLMSRAGGVEWRARGAATLTMTLGGSAGVYYGDEIGMSDTATYNGQLAPMQWSSSDPNAGFSDSDSPWMEPNEDYKTGVNVQDEWEDKDSILNLYKSLIDLRSGLVFLRGSLCLVSSTEETLIYGRELDGIRSVLVIINFSASAQTPALPAEVLPSSGTILLRSDLPSLDRGREVDLGSLEVEAGQGLVIEFDRSMSFRDGGFECYVSRAVCQNSIGLLQKC